MGLVGLVLLSVPVSLGLVSLMEVLHSKRRVILSMLILGFVISGACSPLVSPDFWQGIGQSNYAASNRLIYSTTTEQVAGQLFIGNYDYHYSVTSNYYLEFINAINPHVKFSSLVSISSTGIGYTQLPIGPRPQLILLSFRAGADSRSMNLYAWATPFIELFASYLHKLRNQNRNSLVLVIHIW